MLTWRKNEFSRNSPHFYHSHRDGASGKAHLSMRSSWPITSRDAGGRGQHQMWQPGRQTVARRGCSGSLLSPGSGAGGRGASRVSFPMGHGLWRCDGLRRTRPTHTARDPQSWDAAPGLKGSGSEQTGAAGSGDKITCTAAKVWTDKSNLISHAVLKHLGEEEPPTGNLTSWAERSPSSAPFFCHNCLKPFCQRRGEHQLLPSQAARGIVRIKAITHALCTLTLRVPGESCIQTPLSSEHNQTHLGNSAFILLNTSSQCFSISLSQCIPGWGSTARLAFFWWRKEETTPCVLCTQVVYNSRFLLPFSWMPTAFSWWMRPSYGTFTTTGR